MATQEKVKTYKFIVDQEHFETTDQVLTGAQIKTIAHVDPSVQLFLEERGSGADRPIGDDTDVALNEHGETRLYTMPRATMGGSVI